MNVVNAFLSSFFSIPVTPALFAVLVLVIVGLVVLAGVVIQLGSRLRYLTYPVYDHVIKEAQRRADRIIEEAEEQSRAIRARAQMEAGKVLTDRKKEDERFREEHVKQISEITTHAKDVLSKQTATIHQLSEDIAGEFKKYADTAGTLIDEESKLVESSVAEEVLRMKQSLADISGKTEKEYEALVAETKKSVSVELAKEIQAVRDAVAVYKKGRFAILDQEIVGLVEETAHIALNKTLSLKEHEELVLHALESAKREGIFGQ